MKISLNWIKEYTKVNLPIDKLLDKIGSQLGAIEEVVSLDGKYQGALITKVVSCEHHPNADHLYVCMVDDDGVVKNVPRENGLVKVVCGANNIAAGQTVIWLPPGAIVPETFGAKEPFKLDAIELRGIISFGMIASARELDFGDDHEGIVVVDEEFKPGTKLCEAYGLDDYVIEIENKMFTHRPDCFGILGVAREIAGIQGLQFKSPDWYLNGSLDTGKNISKVLPLSVKNEAPDVVPRFMAVALGNIKVKQSSLKVKIALARIGIKPINNIVDVTNLMMVLTGQPMHAFDYDKVKNLSSSDRAEVVVRLASKGEKVTLLGGKLIEPREGAILITTPRQVIGLGGVMGGSDVEVDDNTKNIILEVANFDMYSIRKTAMEHGLFTDAFTRFSKGQSPLQNDKVLAEAVRIIQKEGGEITSEVFDDNHSKPLSLVQVTTDFINERLGLKLSADEIIKTLKNVEFKIELLASKSELQVEPAFWRTDIVIPEDIVEEVGRLVGYDKIPLELPNRDLTPVNTNPKLDLNRRIRHVLSSCGANEVLTYNFVHGKLLDKCFQNKELAYQLSNALSPDLQYYRMSLTPSLLEKIHPNIKAGHDKFVMFEIGKCHMKGWVNSVDSSKTEDSNLPLEEERLALVIASKNDNKTLAFYEAKTFLKELTDRLGIEIDFEEVPSNIEIEINKQLAAPYSNNRRAGVIIKNSGNFLGLVGEFRPSVSKKLKLPIYCAGFELDLGAILHFTSNSKYKPLSKYPKVEQDISLKVSKDSKFAVIDDLIRQQLGKILDHNTSYELTPLDIYQPKEGDFKHFTFRIKIISYNQTLRSKDVNQILDKVADHAKEILGASRL